MESAELIINSYQDLIKKERITNEEEEEDVNAIMYPIFNENVIFDIINLSIETLKTGKALIEISHPMIIVGDLHGNISDLIKILNIFGVPPDKKYIFLGDFVDRGRYSLAVISLILAYLVKYPENVFLIRGNHEFSHINRAYGFFDEIMLTYKNESMWTKFQELFSWFPLAAVISEAVFCVHGGLSPLLTSLDILRELQMPIPNYLSNSMISDLVWSDPVDTVKGFQINHRGSGQIFGPDVVEQFLRFNKLKLMIRGHQCTLLGFRAFADFMGITVFSSSDYCASIHNKCGIVTLNSERTMSFFSIDEETDFGRMPKAMMSMPVDGDVGLKRILRAISRPDFRIPNPSQSGEGNVLNDENLPINEEDNNNNNNNNNNGNNNNNNNNSLMHRSMSLIENLSGTSP